MRNPIPVTPKRAMEIRGLTEKDVEIITKLSPPTIAKIVNGDNTTTKNIERLAKALHWPFAEILAGWAKVRSERVVSDKDDVEEVSE